MKTIHAMVLLAAGAAVPGLAAEDATMPGGERLFRHAALHAVCQSLERDLKDLEADTLFLVVTVGDECPATQEALLRTMEGEFLRGRIKTSSSGPWQPGQIGSSILVGCISDVLLGGSLYTVEGRNFVPIPRPHGGLLELVFGETASRFGRAAEYVAARAIEDRVQEIAEQLVTQLLELQRDARAGEMCPKPSL